MNYEFGFRYDDAEAETGAEIIGFFNDYTNLTGECSFSGGCYAELLDRQFNAGEVQVYGLETMLSYRLDLGGGLSIPTKLVYTLTQSSFQTDFVSDNPQFGEIEAGDALPYVPVHQASLKLGLSGERFGLNISASFVDEMREVAGQGTPEPGDATDSIFMVDAAFHIDVWGLRLYTKLDNALNEQSIVARRPYGARPNKPLMIQAGVKLDY
jgi:Fe(3+) dicitrate transport protein